MAAIRTLIVASDPLARAGLGAILAAQEGLIVVGQVAAADDLEIALEVYRPDVVLWDTGWQHAAALDAIAALAERGVVVLAIAANDAEVTDLWGSGIRGVVERSVSGEQVAAALGALVAGLYVSAPGFQPAPAARAETPQPLAEPLTPRELDVLKLMADGLSNKLIARELTISEHTVKYHVNAILAKLGAQSRTDAVVRATRAGILLL